MEQIAAEIGMSNDRPREDLHEKLMVAETSGNVDVHTLCANWALAYFHLSK